MKRVYKYFIFLLQFIIPVSLFANYAWVWYIDEPTILPMAIIFTLLFEIVFIIYFNEIKILSKIIFGTTIIIIANILSFLFTILTTYLSDRGYLFAVISEKAGNNFFGMVFYIFRYFPLNYNYGISVLFFTLIIEVPFVYNILKFHINNKKKLLITIFIANIITTIIITIYEKIRIGGVSE